MFAAMLYYYMIDHYNWSFCYNEHIYLSSLHQQPLAHEPMLDHLILLELKP